MVLLAVGGPAWADPVAAGWTGFMRAGPGEGSPVIDEVDAGTVVDVQSCGAGWCRVVANRAVGYLPQALLPTGPAAAAASGEQACFRSPDFTRHGEGVMVYCPKK